MFDAFIVQGDSRPRDWSKFLQSSRYSGVPVVNLDGIPTGKTLQYIRGYFATSGQEVDNAPSAALQKVYFLQAGVHDILGGRTAAQMFDDAKTICQAAKSYGYIAVVFIERKATSAWYTPAQLQTVDDYRTLWLANKHECDELIDLYTMFPDPSDTALLSDGLHDATRGSLLIAREVLTRLP